MHLPLACVLAFVAAAPADPATVAYVRALQTDGGGFRPAADAKTPGLRATSAAVRTLKYHGADVPRREAVAAFVLSCHDPATGGFADTPGGATDVVLTSVGVMAATELGIPKEKFAKAMTYLKANAKTFEEVRIAAGAVEAWGVADCPFNPIPWTNAAHDQLRQPPDPDPKAGYARDVASALALLLRLEVRVPDGTRDHFGGVLLDGQRPDGAWAKAGGGSDLEATYRVMRALYLLRRPPADVAKLRDFIAKCRNPDGGYGVAPGQPSAVGAAYYAAIVTKWLGELDAKK